MAREWIMKEVEVIGRESILWYTIKEGEDIITNVEVFTVVLHSNRAPPDSMLHDHHITNVRYDVTPVLSLAECLKHRLEDYNYVNYVIAFDLDYFYSRQRALLYSYLEGAYGCKIEHQVSLEQPCYSQKRVNLFTFQ